MLVCSRFVRMFNLMLFKVVTSCSRELSSDDYTVVIYNDHTFTQFFWDSHAA